MGGDVRKTADYYAKAISIDPTCLVAHYNLALHLKQEKQLDAALCSFKKVLDLDPNDPTVHSQTGWLMLDIHRQKAQNNWQQVNKFVTGDPEQAALMLEQEALAQKQEEEIRAARLVKAMEHFDTAIALDKQKTYAQAHIGKGQVLIAQKQPVKALAHFEEVADHWPNEFAVHHTL